MDGSEGGGVVGVGHDAHDGSGVVACGGSFSIEGKGEVGDVVDRGVDAGKNGIHVFGIGGGGVKVPVHAFDTAMHIGRGCRNVGVVVVGAGGVVDTGPAVGEGLSVGGSGIVGFVLEVVAVGQRGDQAAKGVASNSLGAAGVGGRAECANREGIVGHRGEPGEGVESVESSVSVGAVAKEPGGFGAAGGPAQGGSVGSDIAQGQVGRPWAGDNDRGELIVAVDTGPRRTCGSGGAVGHIVGRSHGDDFGGA